MQQMLPESAVYHIALAVRILPPLDVSALQVALQAIVDRHDSLRTVVRMEANGELAQTVCARGPVAFEAIETAGSSADEIDASVRAAYRRPFDLAVGPLFRSHLFTNGGQDNLLLVTAHHLVFDALSLGRVFTELLELYSSERSGGGHSLVPIKAGYRDFVEWQSQMLAGPEGEAHLAFWREQLAGAPPVLDLPTDHSRPARPRGRGGSLWLPIENELVQRLKALAADLDVFLFDIFAAAWQVLLSRYSGQTDILTGFVTASRPSLRYARTVGSFSNVIVLRTRLDGDPVFTDFLRCVHERLAQGLVHQDYPFPLLVEKLRPVRVPGCMPLTQGLFTYFMARGSQLSELFVTGHEPAVVQSEAFAMESYGLKQEDLEFDLALSVAEGKRCWSRIRFDADLFDRDTIERLAAHYLSLLQAMAADPSQTVSSVPLLGEMEREEMCRRWNRSRADDPDEDTASGLFEAQVVVAPDRIAVACEDRQLNYAELQAASVSLAAYLGQSGIRRGDLVAVCVERSVEMLVALLAIWKAGAAYVPLDPHFPQARLDLIVEDAAPRIILTEATLAQRFAQGAATVIELDAHKDRWCVARQTDSAAASRSDLAYVIYTSGSTGRPKGVEIQHGALTNFLLSMRERPGLSPGDVLLAVTTFSFDIAGLELFLPLIAGATVVIAARGTALDGRQLAREIDSRGVTVMQATPSGWRVLIESDWPGCARLKALCGGEALPRDLAQTLLSRVGSLWNMYGPTETTVWSAVHEVTQDDDPIPLGLPVDNTALYILDQRLQPVPIGVAGELHIGGAGLARGYRNLPDLTASQFIEHPFVPGARLYKTGDLCRSRTDGSILFLGRLDDQVKLHGHRIELGEIETVLARHHAVQEVAVVLHEQSDSLKRLVAYLVRPAEVLPALPGSLRAFASAQLPRYMVPSVFVYLASLPLTPNSKIDRKALRALTVTSSAPEEHHEYVPPRTRTEAAVAALWAEILKVPRVGVHHRFDELGGDSLGFALMTIRAGSLLGIEIPMQMDHESLTVAGFARTADRTAREAVSVAVAAAKTVKAPSFRTESLTRTWHGQLLVKTCAALVRCLVCIDVDGLENLPARGPAIMAGNHVSFFDFIILGSTLSTLGKRVPVTPTFLVADEWRWLARPYASQLGHTIYIRRGQGDFEALEAAREVLASNGALAITPEGRPTRGSLVRAKPGVAYLACETGVPVWPLAIYGHDRIFDFWKRLRRVPVRVRLGKSLVLNRCGSGSDDLQRHADSIMRAIAELMPREYHGVYSSHTDDGRLVNEATWPPLL
jgi:amino acid adenylation domain-containing protein